MSSVNISIKQEAYEFLDSLKGEEKSFSDVILSFKKRGSLRRFYGKGREELMYSQDNEIRDAFEERL